MDGNDDGRLGIAAELAEGVEARRDEPGGGIAVERKELLLRKREIAVRQSAASIHMRRVAPNRRWGANRRKSAPRERGSAYEAAASILLWLLPPGAEQPLA
jgi:hypothetical protein